MDTNLLHFEFKPFAQYFVALFFNCLFLKIITSPLRSIYGPVFCICHIHKLISHDTLKLSSAQNSHLGIGPVGINTSIVSLQRTATDLSRFFGGVGTSSFFSGICSSVSFRSSWGCFTVSHFFVIHLVAEIQDYWGRFFLSC